MAAAISAAAPSPCTRHGARMISRRRIPPLHHVQHIANRRAGRRRDQADALRISGQRPFSFRREQAFRRELLLELLKRDLQRADALQFHRPHDELVLPARLIDRHVALQQKLLAVLQAPRGS